MHPIKKQVCVLEGVCLCACNKVCEVPQGLGRALKSQRNILSHAFKTKLLPGMDLYANISKVSYPLSPNG